MVRGGRGHRQDCRMEASGAASQAVLSIQQGCRMDMHPSLAHRGSKQVNAKSERDEDQGTVSPG